jgi:quercetin dioxygenase-like cupin family protein
VHFLEGKGMPPRLPFDRQDVGLDGVDYGEFDLTGRCEGLFPFKCSLFSVSSGSSTPIDCHAVLECWLVLCGTGTLHYDGKTHALSAHSLFFIESHKKHFLENCSDTTITVFSIWWVKPDTVKDNG